MMSDPAEKVSNSTEVGFMLPALGTAQPTKVDGHMIVARDLSKAVEALAALPGISPRAAALLAAHALECALHAFLIHKGADASRNAKVWHDLVALWGMAREQGLPGPEVVPDWVTILGSGHDRPFYFRYQKGEGGAIVSGGQTPALIPMADALKEVVAAVEIAVKA